MRDPASPDPEKSAQTDARGGSPVVSNPDRRRIDSDVRAFLREPSTPWIIFDQEGRPPSQLAVGDLLPMARVSMLSEHGFFPATAAIDAAAASHARFDARPEPSSLAVASDLTGDADLGSAGGDEHAADVSIPMRGLSRRLLGVAAACVAVVSTLAIGGYVVRSTSHHVGSAQAQSSLGAPPSLGAPSPADIPPPDFDVSAAAAKLTAVSAPAPAANAPAAPSREREREEAPLKASAKRYARLTVAGDARGRDVFFDGKRMLGRGARSFTVMCGTHTIAVGTRTDSREVDIPCTGAAELVVEK